MRKTNLTLALALGLALLNSCSTPNPREEATALLNQAEEFLQADNYERSIALVDSAISLGMADTLILHRSIGLKKVIRLREAERKSAELISTIEQLHQSMYAYKDKLPFYTKYTTYTNGVCEPSSGHSSFETPCSKGIEWLYDGDMQPPRVRVVYTGAASVDFSAITLPDLLADTLHLDPESRYRYTTEGQTRFSQILAQGKGIEALKQALITLEGELPFGVEVDPKEKRRPITDLRLIYLKGDKQTASYSIPASKVNALREMAMLTQLEQRIQQSNVELAKTLQKQQRLNSQLNTQD